MIEYQMGLQRYVNHVEEIARRRGYDTKKLVYFWKWIIENPFGFDTLCGCEISIIMSMANYLNVNDVLDVFEIEEYEEHKN